MKVGDKLNYIINDFDCVRPIKTPCIVTEVCPDFAIATTDDGMTLWIDEDTVNQFERR